MSRMLGPFAGHRRAGECMSERIATVETFVVSIPRDVPYLGALRAGEEAK
jgi:hypothetical protein